MAVTLAAARRLGAIHHCLEPTSHVHLQHLVTADETMLLCEGDGQRDTVSMTQFTVPSDHWLVCCSFGQASYQQLVVFWPFSVILCEAVNYKNGHFKARLVKFIYTSTMHIQNVP